MGKGKGKDGNGGKGFRGQAWSGKGGKGYGKGKGWGDQSATWVERRACHGCSEVSHILRGIAPKPPVPERVELRFSLLRMRRPRPRLLEALLRRLP